MNRSPLEMLKGWQKGLGMFSRNNLLVDLHNFAVRANHVADPFGGSIFGRCTRAIGQTYFAFGIAQQRIGKALISCKLGIGCHTIGTHT
jgi:hypothetical protein